MSKCCNVMWGVEVLRCLKCGKHTKHKVKSKK